MTPEAYLKIETEQCAIIAAAEAEIARARKIADRAQPQMAKLRRARADDIKAGMLVWHERDIKDGGWYWHIVSEPLHYGDNFKAYIADDGCTHGISGAWVSASPLL